MKNKNITKSLAIVVLSIIIVAGVTYAGSLVPPNTITSQSYTLTDIYNRLNTNTPATVGNHTLSTTANPQASSYTLTQIYNAIPTIDPTKVVEGTSYLGVAGTAKTSGTVSTALTWANDPGFSLCWSAGTYERARGCSVNGLYYKLYDASANHDGSLQLGATEYCNYLNSDGRTVATTPQGYWRLPTKAEGTIKMALALLEYPNAGLVNPGTIDGFRYSGNQGGYWTNEEFNASNAYYVNIDPVSFHAVTANNFYKYDPSIHFRCVH